MKSFTCIDILVLCWGMHTHSIWFILFIYAGFVPYLLSWSTHLKCMPNSWLLTEGLTIYIHGFLVVSPFNKYCYNSNKLWKCASFCLNLATTLSTLDLILIKLHWLYTHTILLQNFVLILVLVLAASRRVLSRLAC